MGPIVITILENDILPIHALTVGHPVREYGKPSDTGIEFKPNANLDQELPFEMTHDEGSRLFRGEKLLVVHKTG